MPEIHDRPPPRWTGVPVERDPGTGKLLRGDPGGRGDKGRAGRSGAKGPMVAAAMVALVAATLITAWLTTSRLEGDQATAAAPTPATTSSIVPGSATAGPTSPPGPTATSDPPTTASSTAASGTMPSTTAASTTAASSTAPGAPAALPPLPPSGLTATPVDQTAIRLAWTDNSTDETAFEINDGEVSRFAAADAREYRWDGLGAGQHVCFRMRAVGAAGPSGWHPGTSPSSVCATTRPPEPTVDLVAQGIEVLPGTTVCAGTSPTFRARIRNAGTEGSGDFAVRWIADGVQVVDGGHAGIPGGATDTHDHVWHKMTPGPHELRIVADHAQHIEEIDEANNESVLQFTAEPCAG